MLVCAKLGILPFLLQVIELVKDEVGTLTLVRGNLSTCSALSSNVLALL